MIQYISEISWSSSAEFLYTSGSVLGYTRLRVLFLEQCISTYFEEYIAFL